MFHDFLADGSRDFTVKVVGSRGIQVTSAQPMTGGVLIRGSALCDAHGRGRKEGRRQAHKNILTITQSKPGKRGVNGVLGGLVG